MAKLSNGHALAVLTTASITFQVTGLTLPELDGGELPDTTTNSNGTYRSVGTRKFIKIGNFTLTGAFDSADYTALNGVLNVADTLTVTDVDGTTYVASVIPMKYTPSEMTEDGFPTADVEFSVVTGETGSAGIVVTSA
jgi:hypothetical protein